MKKIGKKVMESVAKISMEVAMQSPSTMSVFYFYEPKMPEKLRKEDKSRVHRSMILLI